MRSRQFTSCSAALIGIRGSQTPRSSVRQIFTAPRLSPMKLAFKLVALVLLLVAPSLAAQQHGELRSLAPDGLALGGFDPVSYFPAGGMAAAIGSEKFEFKLGPARYRFVSAEHLAWFKSETERYEPAYGGFDAASIAGGGRKPASPQSFKVVGARLFLFAEPTEVGAFDAKQVSSADEAWKKLSGESARGVAADDARVGVKWNLGKDQLAIEGFDPVSYFPEGGGSPVKGDPKLESVLDGARYRFASAAHQKWFLAEPARYRPKYGGWCAYAMVDGDDVEVDPKSFLIEHSRLLLFYKGFLADTRAKWLPKAQEFAPKADAAWAKHALK